MNIAIAKPMKPPNAKIYIVPKASRPNSLVTLLFN